MEKFSLSSGKYKKSRLPVQGVYSVALVHSLSLENLAVLQTSWLCTQLGISLLLNVVWEEATDSCLATMNSLIIGVQTLIGNPMIPFE